MTEREAFVRAICEGPGDDTRRLAFADWLDENARAVPCPECPPDEGDDPHEIDIPCVRCGGSGTVPDWLERWAEFVRSHVRCPEERHAGTLPRVLAAVILPEPCWADLPATQVHLSRGFVSRIECSGMFWCRHADAILTAHPVERVSLTSRLEFEWKPPKWESKAEARLQGRPLWHPLEPGCYIPSALLKAEARLQGRPLWHPLEPGCYIPSALLKAEWPRLTFDSLDAGAIDQHAGPRPNLFDLGGDHPGRFWVSGEEATT